MAKQISQVIDFSRKSREQTNLTMIIDKGFPKIGRKLPSKQRGDIYLFARYESDASWFPFTLSLGSWGVQNDWQQLPILGKSCHMILSSYHYSTPQIQGFCLRTAMGTWRSIVDDSLQL